mmetsp:Transcript_38927/g.105415  ORF Transcript_38927/g.105415 Transcript_38927/m.105415 type:complete len:207 (-) Transcript_38927:408-1028(-)
MRRTRCQHGGLRLTGGDSLVDQGARVALQGHAARRLQLQPLPGLPPAVPPGAPLRRLRRGRPLHLQRGALPRDGHRPPQRHGAGLQPDARLHGRGGAHAHDLGLHAAGAPRGRAAAAPRPAGIAPEHHGQRGGRAREAYGGERGPEAGAGSPGLGDQRRGPNCGVAVAGANRRDAGAVHGLPHRVCRRRVPSPARLRPPLPPRVRR